MAELSCSFESHQTLLGVNKTLQELRNTDVSASYFGGDDGWGWGWVRRVHSVVMINFVCFDFLMFVMFENHNFFSIENIFLTLG